MHWNENLISKAIATSQEIPPIYSWTTLFLPLVISVNFAVSTNATVPRALAQLAGLVGIKGNLSGCNEPDSDASAGLHGRNVCCPLSGLQLELPFLAPSAGSIFLRASGREEDVHRSQRAADNKNSSILNEHNSHECSRQLHEQHHVYSKSHF